MTKRFTAILAAAALTLAPLPRPSWAQVVDVPVEAGPAATQAGVAGAGSIDSVGTIAPLELGLQPSLAAPTFVGEVSLVAPAAPQQPSEAALPRDSARSVASPVIAVSRSFSMPRRSAASAAPAPQGAVTVADPRLAALASVATFEGGLRRGATAGGDPVEKSRTGFNLIYDQDPREGDADSAVPAPIDLNWSEGAFPHDRQARLGQSEAGRDLGTAPTLSAPAAKPGKVPSAATMLERAAAAGVAKRAVGEVLQDGPKTLVEAAARLQTLGLVKPGEFDASDEARAVDFRYALHKLWFEVAPETPAQVETDSRWSVPAFVARKDGKTYYVHGVQHGQGVEYKPGPVRALVEDVKTRGAGLVSEYLFPAYFGYSYGKETLDHASADGLPAAARDAAGPADGLGRALKRAFNLMIVPGSLVATVAVLVHDPSTVWAWLAVGPVAAFNYLAWNAMRPILQLQQLLVARRGEREFGDADMAHYFRNNASLMASLVPSPADLRRGELPMPLKAYEDNAIQNVGVSRRSAAIAAAARREAAASGAAEVHVLVGANHAQETAWALAH